MFRNIQTKYLTLIDHRLPKRKKVLEKILINLVQTVV